MSRVCLPLILKSCSTVPAFLKLNVTVPGFLTDFAASLKLNSLPLT